MKKRRIPPRRKAALTNDPYVRCFVVNIEKMPSDGNALLSRLSVDCGRMINRLWSLWKTEMESQNVGKMLAEDYEAYRAHVAGGKAAKDYQWLTDIAICPSDMQTYLRQELAEEFPQIHNRVVMCHQQAWLGVLTKKEPSTGLATWQSVLLGRIHPPLVEWSAPLRFDQANLVDMRWLDAWRVEMSVRLSADRDKETGRAITLPPQRVVMLLGSKSRGIVAPYNEPVAELVNRWIAHKESKTNKNKNHPPSVYWPGTQLRRNKWGKWVIDLPLQNEPRRRNQRTEEVRAEIRGAADGSVAVKIGTETIVLKRGIDQARHERRRLARQLLGAQRRAGWGDRCRGRARRERQQRALSGVWPRMNRSINRLIACSVASLTGQKGAGTIVYCGGTSESLLATIGMDDETPRQLRGWPWHDLGTEIARKLAHEGVFVERQDGYLGGGKGRKAKPREEKRKKRLEVASK